MIVHFTARRIDLTPEVKRYCEKRLKALEKLLDAAIEVDLTLSVQKNSSRAEIHVLAKGAGLVVVEETTDMLESLNLAFDNLEKKVKKDRAKFRERKRRQGRERLDLGAAPEAPDEERRILRAPHYSPKPMTIEDAVIQLDAKNKEVFVFRKEDSGTWAVLYRRKDGHIGLVEPE
jgi:putative sigma-54 modulation protein